MGGFFFEMGRRLGPTYRKGRYVLSSLFGDEKETIEAEAQVGRDLAERTRADMPRDETPSEQLRLSSLLSRLQEKLTRRDRDFHIEIVGSDQQNAFALPGGWIFITRPLFDVLESDDELAFVIAHEMAHVLKKHPMERIITDATVDAAIRALPKARLLAGIAQAAGRQLVMNAYSRDRELVADRFAGALMYAAQLDPMRGMLVLDRLTKDSASLLSLYFSTHPPKEERLAEIRRALRALENREKGSPSEKGS